MRCCTNTLYVCNVLKWSITTTNRTCEFVTCGQIQISRRRDRCRPVPQAEACLYVITSNSSSNKILIRRSHSKSWTLSLLVVLTLMTDLHVVGLLVQFSLLLFLLIHSFNYFKNNMASSKRGLSSIDREGDEKSFEDYAPPSKKPKPSN